MTDDLFIMGLQSTLQRTFKQWANRQPPRTGLHLASLLESDKEWCTRQHVLAEVAPDERGHEQHDWHTNAYFVHGWSLHEKWQHKLLGPVDDLVMTTSIGDMLELDITHQDEITDIEYSPDAILNYRSEIVPLEIKGIRTQDYQLLCNGTLEQACSISDTIRKGAIQLNLYLHLLRMEGKQVERGIMLIEDKNTQDFTLFVVNYEEDKTHNYMARAASVRDCTNEYHAVNVLPTAICSSRSQPRAKRCPVADACFNRQERGE